MDLAFRSSCPNGAPDYQVRVELRRDRVEKFARRGETQGENIEEKISRRTQAVVDRKATVEIRVVDQSLPAHRCAWLFEIDAHHDAEIVGELAPACRQPLGIFESRDRIVNRAGPDHHEQAIIPTR